MKVADNHSMAMIDRQTIETYGVPGSVLMENAARSSYELIRDEYPDRRRLIILCGPGNNGGDGLAIARHARVDGCEPEVWLVKEDGSPDFSHQLALARAYGVPCGPIPNPLPRLDSPTCVIVDALSGTGLVDAYRHPTHIDAVNSLGDSGVPVVSLDLPSGLGDQYREDWPSVRADLVVFMGLPKRCAFLPRARNRWKGFRIARVGFPPELLEAQNGELLGWPVSTVPVARDAHKGTRGHVGVFGGSTGTTGAPGLCAEGAARAGAGLVTLCVDRSIYPLVAPAFRGIMVRPLTDELELGRFSSLAVGPGWGVDSARASILRELAASELPGVLDADGINLLAQMEAPPRFGGRWVLTPHPGEFRRLCQELDGVDYDPEQPWSALHRVSGLLDAVIVLKGAVTYLSEPSGCYAILDGQEPALATGGSGDVLCGIVAGLLARGMEAFDAAIAGVALHHEAGVRTKARLGAFLAEDLLPEVSRLGGEDF
jgi:hydroxyethylthiazole kinase-like uncharacterized protein yjeF